MRPRATVAMIRVFLEVLVCTTALLASSARAFHRQTPPLVVLTTGGDTDLPHVPSQGRRLLALADGTGGIVTLFPFRTQDAATSLAAAGTNPAVSFTGGVVAYDTDADPLTTGLPGSQIVLWRKGTLSAGAADPSGTSVNPSLDKSGRMLVFESAGGLAGPPAGVNRVYVRDKRGNLAVVSSGSGWSGHAMLGAKRGVVAFESTSDPTTGVDTGTTQIWVGRVTSLPAARITDGATPSTNPIVSDDGRLVAFVSEADLAGSGAGTGVPQIFVYDTWSQTFARLTNEPAPGCGRPAVAKVGGDWRTTFVCNGQAYYHMLRRNTRHHVPTPDGPTQSIVPVGVHFLTMSTKADLVAGSGATPGYRIYLWNLFVNPVAGVPGSATWFPFQGIPYF